MTVAFELDDLLIAFRLHVASLAVEDDDVTTASEAAHLAATFPVEELRARGFVDGAGARTQRFHDAAVEALDALPSRLSVSEKHALLEDAWAAATADDELRVGEGGVVLMAARLLGLSDAEFDAFVDGRRHGAGVTAAALDSDE